jgi:hypothetical protein
MADDYEGRNESGRYGNQQDAFTAIRCVDDPFPSDPAAWADIDRQARQAAPYSSYGQFTGYAPRDVCALWPVPPTSAPHQVSSPGPGKVVVVSTTRDPATPYTAGVDLADELGASLITFDGTQHTIVFKGNSCIDPPVLAFLTDSVAPPANLQC